MADNFTPVLNMTKPEIDASAETWGQKLNADLDLLDAHAGSMQAFAASQPANIAAAVAAALAAAIPRGCILAWYGQPNTVPPGWLLCNGLNGTPNLADRFILGTAGVRPAGEVGGSFTSGSVTDTRGSHSHGGNTAGHVLTEVEMPYHQHGGGTDSQGVHVHSVPTQGDLGAAGGGFPIPVDKNYGFRGVTTDAQGGHVHNIVTDFRGGNGGHWHDIGADGAHTHNINVSIAPPYFSLCYIMRA